MLSFYHIQYNVERLISLTMIESLKYKDGRLVYLLLKLLIVNIWFFQVFIFVHNIYQLKEVSEVKCTHKFNKSQWQGLLI